MRIREAAPADDPLLVRFYHQLWESYGVPAEQIRTDAEDRTLGFLLESRRDRQGAAFIAELEGKPVGMSAAELFRAPYPEVMHETHRRFGYVWCVYVEPAFRRRGIARGLTERCLAHLRVIGCTHVALHSSEAGVPLYEAMGFERGREMRLELRR